MRLKCLREKWIVMDEDTCRWEAPVPYPEDADPTICYMWDEDNIQWVLEEPPELET